MLELCGTFELGFHLVGCRKDSVRKPAPLCVVCSVYTTILINYCNCFNFVLLLMWLRMNLSSLEGFFTFVNSLSCNIYGVVFREVLFSER